mmetsp:Transcript_77672/g.90619  ORF Transcript_77672/g.90619 Transcript_77672/m.90619 type:complete len:282 (-) Transcript_77672:217-1062(-)
MTEHLVQDIDVQEQCVLSLDSSVQVLLHFEKRMDILREVFVLSVNVVFGFSNELFHLCELLSDPVVYNRMSDLNNLLVVRFLFYWLNLLTFALLAFAFFWFTLFRFLFSFLRLSNGLSWLLASESFCCESSSSVRRSSNLLFLAMLVLVFDINGHFAFLFDLVSDFVRTSIEIGELVRNFLWFFAFSSLLDDLDIELISTALSVLSVLVLGLDVEDSINANWVVWQETRTISDSFVSLGVQEEVEFDKGSGVVSLVHRDSDFSFLWTEILEVWSLAVNFGF